MCWSTMWGKSQRSYNAAVLRKNPMFHFLFIFGSFLRFRRRVWFTVAIFGSFFISFLVHFYCQPSSVGGKNEPKMKSKMRQKRPKSATVSTPIVLANPDNNTNRSRSFCRVGGIGIPSPRYDHPCVKY